VTYTDVSPTSGVVSNVELPYLLIIRSAGNDLGGVASDLADALSAAHTVEGSKATLGPGFVGQSNRNRLMFVISYHGASMMLITVVWQALSKLIQGVTRNDQAISGQSKGLCGLK